MKEHQPELSSGALFFLESSLSQAKGNQKKFPIDSQSPGVFFPCPKKAI